MTVFAEISGMRIGWRWKTCDKSYLKIDTQKKK
jgi:hypothetical protein